jgi:tripartite-type tricarboxylate transporter receptor subunit TctC
MKKSFSATEEKSMHILKTTCGIALLTALSAGASAQQFPTKPIRMIVPSTPGGSSDTLARLVGEHLQTRLGQTVITENRPGAGQTIGSAHVVKSDPDGHTMEMVTVTYTTSSAIYSRLPYDPEKDLIGAAMIGKGPLILVVHPSLPVKSVKELVALAKSKPRILDFASAGNGTIPHLALELFALSADIDVVHVPYKGISPAVTAVVAGEVPALIGSAPSTSAMIRAKRLHALAVTTAKRSPHMPELPTIAEAGVPGYDVATWWGVLVHAQTPTPIVTKLNQEFRQILAIEDVSKRIRSDGAEPELDMTAEEFTALIKRDIAKWRTIVKKRNIKTL